MWGERVCAYVGVASPSKNSWRDSERNASFKINQSTINQMFLKEKRIKK
jgi:hypothetical protein